MRMRLPAVAKTACYPSSWLVCSRERAHSTSRVRTKPTAHVSPIESLILALVITGAIYYAYAIRGRTADVEADAITGEAAIAWPNRPGQKIRRPGRPPPQPPFAAARKSGGARRWRREPSVACVEVAFRVDQGR
jgi:hypothetical protein